MTIANPSGARRKAVSTSDVRAGNTPISLVLDPQSPSFKEAEAALADNPRGTLTGLSRDGKRLALRGRSKPA